MAERLPPHDLDAEESVLGSIIIDGEAISKINLLPSDFYSERNMSIYVAMLFLNKQKVGINQITVCQELARQDKLDKCGGAAYLSHLIGVTPTSLDIEHYASIVLRYSFYRHVIDIGHKIINHAYQIKPDIAMSVDEYDQMVQGLRTKMATIPRKLNISHPRIIKTEPQIYKWNVNGKDLLLKLPDITKSGSFKNKVVAELNIVPIMPKDWDDVVNNLLTHSILEEAPKDASDKYQIKVFVQKWLEQMRETNMYADLSTGSHLIREIDGKTYFCFQSTPLLSRLKRNFNRVFKSGDLWATYISRWGGIRKSFRAKTADGGSMPASDLWCLPGDFMTVDMGQPTQQKMDIPQSGIISLEDF